MRRPGTQRPDKKLGTPDAPPHSTSPTIEVKGITVFCHALLAQSWEWDPRPLMLLSVGGPREAVKGVIAAAMTGYDLSLHGAPAEPAWSHRPQFHIQHADQYHILSRRLPSGQVHGLLFPADALPTHTEPHFTLLVQQHECLHAPARLLEAIDRRSELPLHPSWYSWLWEMALATEWLSPLIGFGLWNGWTVNYDEPALAEALSQTIRSHSLTVPLPATDKPPTSTPDTASRIPT